MPCIIQYTNINSEYSPPSTVHSFQSSFLAVYSAAAVYYDGSAIYGALPHYNPLCGVLNCRLNKCKCY